MTLGNPRDRNVEHVLNLAEGLLVVDQPPSIGVPRLLDLKFDTGVTELLFDSARVGAVLRGQQELGPLAWRPIGIAAGLPPTKQVARPRSETNTTAPLGATIKEVPKAFAWSRQLVQALLDYTILIEKPQRGAARLEAPLGPLIHKTLVWNQVGEA